MKKINGVIIIYFLFLVSGCEKATTSPQGVDLQTYNRFYETYSFKWGSYSIENKNILREVELFLGKTYSVIWKGDMDADCINDYLIVVKDNRIHHGIIRGMVIDDKGTKKLFFDVDKGFYAPSKFSCSRLVNNGEDDEVLLFHRLGIKKGEVKCMRLSFTKKSFLTTKNDRLEALQAAGIVDDKHFTGYTSAFTVHLIDSEDNLMATPPIWFDKKEAAYIGSLMIAKNINHYRQITTMTFTVFAPDINSEYNSYKQAIDLYRKNKAKGVVVKAVNFLP